MNQNEKTWIKLFCMLDVLIQNTNEINQRLKMFDESCPNHYDMHNIHCLICDFAEKCRNEEN